MAPSGGSTRRPCQQYERERSKLMLGIIFMMCLPRITEAAVDAKGQYAMDTREDCQMSGFLDVPRDQVTYIQGRSVNARGQQLSCYLQFMPKNSKDTLEMTLDSSAYIEDCGVTLELQMTGFEVNGLTSNPVTVTHGPHTLGCRSNFRSIASMKAVNGKAQVRLVRKTVDDTSYGFQVRITARQTVDDEAPGGSSGGDTALIAGIIAGAIVIIIIAIIICVCCYRKRRAGDKNADYKKNLANESMPTSISHGVDNSTAKNGMADPLYGSPGSERRLLSKNSFDEVERGNKPKSALERFGPPPSQRRRPNRDEGGSGDSDIVYHEREVRRPARGNEDRDMEKERQAPVSNERPPRSPFLADLHENKRFRRSFHENEVDANDRQRRLSDNNGSIHSSEDSNGQPRRKPTLPPVPKSPPRSPSPQRRGEKIAAIFRARPSSSSSEVARLDEDDVSLSDRPTRSDKPDTRHTLRPNRGERSSERKPREEKRKNRRDDDDSDEEERRCRREKDRRDEERQRRRRQEEEEEEREEREREKEAERRRRKREEEDRQEEKSRKERDGEYEGRFKKSASGRRSKGKGTRMGRSRSTGNALEEMDAKYQRSRSKSPSSVRSLNFIEDDEDDDLDSNYMPFRRAGSKTSLYASRSSLYGRKRKNSMGETMSMSSYAHDDVDSRMGDFDRIRMSHREKERMFKSTSDLEMRPASAVMVRDCATWTGSDKGVYIYGRRTLAVGKRVKRYNRGTQTHSGRQRRDSTGSARSGRSTRSNQRLKSRSKSQESLRKEKRSRSRDFSEDDSDSDRSRHRNHRSKSRDRIKDDSYSDSVSSKPKSKPKARPRKSAGTASVDLSDSDDDFDNKSGAASSVAPSSIYPPSQQAAYGTQFVPAGYPVQYQQPGVVYVPGGHPTAPGGPPMMMGTVAPGIQNAPPAKPAVAPKPNRSKWDELVNLTDGMKQRRRQMGESITEDGSVMSSMWSQPVHANPKNQAVYAPPSYTTAQRLPDQNSSYSSAYPTSSGNQYPRGAFEYNNSHYTPSESNI